MAQIEDIQFFRNSLLSWFSGNGRMFPWRSPKASIYNVVLSEILLQRTKAETVAKYYKTFFKRFPNWKSLGRASQSDFEKILKPLGLYRHRAKRLNIIAQALKKNNWVLPVEQEQIKEYGFNGLYVANAYQLFVLGKRRPLIDVNMSRLLKRYFEPGDFIDVRNDVVLQDLSSRVTNIRKCKELNWAILDYAAIVCKSRKPVCENCVLKSRCNYYSNQNNKIQMAAEPFVGYQLNLEIEHQIKAHKNINVLSLFSGCGGMDLGFEGGFFST